MAIMTTEFLTTRVAAWYTFFAGVGLYVQGGPKTRISANNFRSAAQIFTIFGRKKAI